jgi:ligand-binding sensor domain-containing protein
MVQDRDGYLWFGTSNGLCRYDGYSFLVFPTIGTGGGITNANVGTIHIDEKNQLMWLRSATFNYACYDLRRKQFVDYTGTCDAQKIFERFYPEEGGIWMYEANAGMRHVTYRDGKFTCRDYTQADGSLPVSKVRRLKADGAGNIWILTDKGLLRADKNGNLQQVVKSGDFMMLNHWKDKVFALSRDGRVLVFNNQGKLLREVRVPSEYGNMGRVNGNIVWHNKIRHPEDCRCNG